jgi:hypothetical protein
MLDSVELTQLQIYISMAGLAKPKATPVDTSIAITIAVRKLARSGYKVALHDEARL